MSFLATFFVASPEELRRHFPHRHAVAKELHWEETVNPFTQQVAKVQSWRPTEKVPAPPAGTEFPTDGELAALDRLPHCELKGISPVELAAFEDALGLADYETAFQDLLRDQFVTPTAEDMMIPSPDKVAESCQLNENFDEWTPEDVRDAWAELQPLAKAAARDGIKLIYWVYGL
jgi:hypothetical protein